ncbi:MAG: hypothetical protein JWM18_3595 [Chloroflexi bacterium]|nr:hypothetical protein [Chloroflexota bacterium]
MLPPPRAFADADIVLPDATTFMAFAKTDNMADLMSYLGDRLRVTRDVLREIRRHVMETPDLRTFIAWVDATDPQQIAPLTSQESRTVFDLGRAVQRPGDHPLKHIGEFATVVAGRALHRSLGGVFVCVDDNDGRKFAARSVPHGTTADLVIELVVQGMLTKADGKEIWQRGLYTENLQARATYGPRPAQYGL